MTSPAGLHPLECVINVSEGTAGATIGALARAAGSCLLDVHTDPWHNRSVLTLAGRDVQDAARAVAGAAVEHLDLNDHAGAHPRLGVIDVVPFVPLRTGVLGEVPAGASGPAAVSLAPALAARDAVRELYGNRARRSVLPLRTGALPAGGSPAGLHHRITRHGPHDASPHGGTCCVGAREVLVAYNMWLAVDDVALAREIARSMRRTEVRALGLELGGKAQVSCNLVEPWRYGPAEAFDFVSRRAPVARRRACRAGAGVDPGGCPAPAVERTRLG